MRMGLDFLAVLFGIYLIHNDGWEGWMDRGFWSGKGVGLGWLHRDGTVTRLDIPRWTRDVQGVHERTR